MWFTFNHRLNSFVPIKLSREEPGTIYACSSRELADVLGTNGFKRPTYCDTNHTGAVAGAWCHLHTSPTTGRRRRVTENRTDHHTAFVLNRVCAASVANLPWNESSFYQRLKFASNLLFEAINSFALFVHTASVGHGFNCLFCIGCRSFAIFDSIV